MPALVPDLDGFAPLKPVDNLGPVEFDVLLCDVVEPRQRREFLVPAGGVSTI